MTNEQLETMLARIDERTASIKTELADVKSDMRKRYVTRDEFGPVQKIVYGLVALILMAVGTGIVSLVISSK